jgi:DNA-binding NtrC family response regulator
MRSHRLLIVDDEPDLRWVLRGLFTDEGFEVDEAADGQDALLAIGRCEPDVVLSDMRMPRLPGLELLRCVRKQSPDLPVILLSAVEDLATAVEAIKEGAFDYQAKPFDAPRLLLSVRRAAEQHALRREVKALRCAPAGATLDFGPSRRAQELRRHIELVAPQPSVAVLLRGESGTGKEVVARAIHALSPLAGGPFVAVDCGALPETLLESQLFGHEKGAFTGADRARSGLFPMADGGTLFLDEIGNLPLPLQAKLLRALQERVVVPVGGQSPVPFRARLLAATNADLQAEIAAGRFRVDLFHRIAEFHLVLPPLRERRDDVLHFARMFLAEANAELGRSIDGFTAAGEHALQQSAWPGNVRELRNVIRRSVLTCAAKILDSSDLALPDGEPALGPQSPVDAFTEVALPLAERLRHATDTMEAEILRTTLGACGGNKAAAARALRIDYTTLHRKLKRHGILA